MLNIIQFDRHKIGFSHQQDDSQREISLKLLISQRGVSLKLETGHVEYKITSEKPLQLLQQTNLSESDVLKKYKRKRIQVRLDTGPERCTWIFC